MICSSEGSNPPGQEFFPCFLRRSCSLVWGPFGIRGIGANSFAEFFEGGMKYIFITGGVMSGLGKGITAASIGRLLKNGDIMSPRSRSIPT